jgi:hypothetical protein
MNQQAHPEEIQWAHPPPLEIINATRIWWTMNIPANATERDHKLNEYDPCRTSAIYLPKQSERESELDYWTRMNMTTNRTEYPTKWPHKRELRTEPKDDDRDLTEKISMRKNFTWRSTGLLRALLNKIHTEFHAEGSRNIRWTAYWTDWEITLPAAYQLSTDMSCGERKVWHNVQRRWAHGPAREMDLSAQLCGSGEMTVIARLD